MLHLLTVSATLVAPVAQPATQGPMVEGWIHNAKGKPLQATVGLISAARRSSSLALKSTESLSAPNKKKPGFHLAAPAPGLYLLDVRARGHEPLQVPVLFGAEGLQDLTLSPRPEKGETAPYSPDAKVARWAELYRDLKARESRVLGAYREARSKQEKVVLPDLNADVEQLTKALQEERDSDTQGLVALCLLNTLNQGAKLSPEVAGQALDKLPATSPFWGLNPRLASEAFAAAKRHKDLPAFREAMAKDHPDTEVRAMATLGLLAAASRQDEAEKTQALYTKLTTEYKGTLGAESAKPYRPERQASKGKAFPAFEFKDLEGKAVNLAAYQGKLLLVDFWASWCPPCVAEMPALHAVHAKYKSAGLEILSVSLDAKVEDIAAFRAGENRSMPWTHVFLGKGSKDPILSTLQVTTIPRPFLVGPEGKVLVSDGLRLRGAHLAQTVEQSLKELGLKPEAAPKTPEAPLPAAPEASTASEAPVPSAEEAPEAPSN